MIDIKNLNKDELKKIGIAFEKESLARKFCIVVRGYYDTRVGRLVSEKVPKKEMDILNGYIDREGIMGDDCSRQIAEWRAKNVPDYDQLCEKVRKEMEDELIKYKDSIKGNIGCIPEEDKSDKYIDPDEELKISEDISDGGFASDDLDFPDYTKKDIEELSLSERAVKYLRGEGINTIGELERLSISTIASNIRNLHNLEIYLIIDKLKKYYKDNNITF
jgi:DNA-directed RNA polymerase, alpha subunit/40 kD subunit